MNGEAVTKWEIKILEDGGTIYTEDLTNCDGSDPTIFANKYCLIPMTDLIAAPYLLDLGDTVRAVVRSNNPRGWSTVSTANAIGVGATIQTAPGTMTIPTKNAGTSESQIIVDWAALVANGGSTITSYHLQYDNNSGGTTWSDLIGLSPASIAQTYTLTSVTAGASYQFKVRAKNIFGWGVYSPVLTIQAAVAPSMVATPTLSIDATSGDAKITWLEPHDGSDTITSYKIEIQTTLAGSTWSEYTTTCDGTNAAIIA